MKNYEDKNIRFMIPADWKVNYFGLDDRLIYTVVIPSDLPGHNFTMDICVDPENPYMASMDKQGLTDLFNEEPSVANYEVEHCEILTNPMDKKIFYLVQKPVQDTSLPYKISLFLPVGEPNAKSTVISSYNVLAADTYKDNHEQLLALVQSIAILQ
jgi:hypothetical protein